jgi:lysine 2,3-aminomutase
LNAPLRTPRQIVEAGLAPIGRLAELERVAGQYAIAITPAFADLIDPADPADPIARQLVPDERELNRRPEELTDPVGDETHMPVAGVVHRYPDRVLLKLTHTCAVYCRFCFRREMVGPGGHGDLSAAQVDAALAYIAGRPAVWEVILTGGDPLVLSPRRLADVMRRLAAVEHVKVVRLHTRVPVAAPERITPALVEALRSGAQAVYVALHANHARELSLAARQACARLVDAGIPMIGQTVLLKGVNDSPDALAGLFRAMVETRIKPYYLHHGDLAPGTSHLRTSLDEGQALMRALRGTYSGLCQPTYVLDIPGGHGKAPVGPNYVGEHGRVQDPWGVDHAYPPET